ncbi:N-acetylneuraminate synthase [Alteribacillus bidgolensis]|uniref:N-acetylneuraminate synthase n=1 Tax=Alteribacillus bidgolensis TaxID=930129 RepID=A0A1G8JHH8_9BACI|nr:N-acetylneuraminate synthase [Alteribacillus bidgolensis]SDI30665.1 N-acetylneuraminate synthase [Alteribacillus bidgolensis]
MKDQKHVFIIAEAGVNHNGSLDMAKKLIDAAARAGVDAVKFQTFKTEQMILPQAPKAVYQMQNTDLNKSQYEMIKKLELDQQMHYILKEYCLQRKIQFMSTPFDTESLDFLVNTLHIPRIKIASGEITNAPLLLQAARSQKNIILSTGMSTLGEIEEALGVLAFAYLEQKSQLKNPSRNAFKEAYYSEEAQNYLNQHVSLLHCTTEYPTPFHEANLRVLNTLSQCFHLETGYSDHTLGTALPLAAVSLGATIIEKHFTLDRNLPGPDHKASLEPEELTQMVQGIRQIEQALGYSYKKPAPSELKNKEIARKSIVAAKHIQKGELFTEENLTVKRPGKGISPLEYWNLLGEKASKSYVENEMIK